MRQEEGTFIVKYYDDLGAREGKEEAECLTQAHEKAKEHDKNGGSTVVYRILYNSLQRRNSFIGDWYGKLSTNTLPNM